MIRRQTTPLLVAALTLVLSGLAHAGLEVGERPRLNLRTMDGKTITSDDLRGRLTILEFWATWCPPCRAQIPHLKKLHANYRDKGVVLISVSIDKAQRTAEAFISEHQMNWTHVHDPSQQTQLGTAWGVRGIPHAFIFSPQGELLWRGHPARIDAPLEGFLKSHPPSARGKAAGSAGPSDEVIQASLASLKAAREAVDAGDLPGMLRAVAEISEESLSHGQVIGQARVLLLKLRQSGFDPAALQAARDADAESDKRLRMLMQAIAPRAKALGAAVLAANDAEQTGPSPRVVETKLKQAEQAHQREQHGRAYGLYQWLIEHAGASDAGAAAAERIASYEADDQIMHEIKAARAEQDARSILAMAQSYEAAGKPELAKELYQKLLDQFSATDGAAQAKVRLAAME